MPITALIHVTAAYSNAVLVAILPHVSDCAKQLDLPIQQPITVVQVDHFNASRIKGEIGGGLWLTNRYWFAFSSGCVDSFRSPDDWFTNQELENLGRFVGKENMTTNEVIDFARKSITKLGYNVADCHMNGTPTSIEGPLDVNSVGHIPYCRVVWEKKDAGQRSYSVKFDVDMQRKQVVGMVLLGTNFCGPDPEINVVPESDSSPGLKPRSMKPAR